MSGFPTADEVAMAIVAAARLHGEDPIAVARGNASRARHVAMEALMAAFEDARRASLARCVGYRKPTNGQTQTCLARKADWWNEVAIDEIVGQLVAERYGERAL